MSAQTPVAKDHPLMIAWDKYKATEEYANNKKWAMFPERSEDLDGSLWALFVAGWDAAGGPNGGIASSPSMPADDETMMIRFMYELHSNVPEVDRPMSRSDFSDEQWARVKTAFATLPIETNTQRALSGWQANTAAAAPTPLSEKEQP